MTIVEARILEMLKRSYLDVTKPFEAKDACEAIILTPTMSGKSLANAPNPTKLAYMLRKSPDFEVYSPRQSKIPAEFILKSEG